MTFTFGPNSGGGTLLDAIRTPGAWTTPHCQTLDLDWWHFVSDADQATSNLKRWLGPNTYTPIAEVGLGQVPDLLISGEACKEHDPTGEKNLAKWEEVVVPRVQAIGGAGFGITLDEPLTSTVPGRFQPEGRVYPWTVGAVDHVAELTAHVITSLGRTAVLYEAWPQHPAERLRDFLTAARANTGPLLVRFVLDVDTHAITASDDLGAAVGLLGATCDSLGVEFAISGSPSGTFTRSDDFTVALRTWLARIAPLASHLTVESWHENDGRKEYPRTLGARSLASTLAWVDRTYAPTPTAPEPSGGLMPITGRTRIKDDRQAAIVSAEGEHGELHQNIVTTLADAGVPLPPSWRINKEKYRLGLWRISRDVAPPDALDDIAALAAELTPEPDPPPNPNLPPPDSWKQARGSYLYSSTKEDEGDTSFWLAASRYVNWGRAKRRDYGETQVGNTHIVVACNTGTRGALKEVYFDALASVDSRARVREAIRDANEDGYQVWPYLATQEHLDQRLGLPSGSWDGLSSSQFDDLVDVLVDTLDLIGDLVFVCTPFREIGDKFSGASLDQRNQIFRALREAHPTIALANHERSLEGVPVSDFTGVAEPTISALQTGFGTSTAEAAAFVAENVERMAIKMPGHRVILFEAHIPPNVYSSTVISTSFAEAKNASRNIVTVSEAAGDMNAGTL